jgi:peroxiredoxin Q/BCP
MKTLNSKDMAPYFDLKDQNGQHVRLSDFSGKKIFLYFYPKANTSG